jgi:hypothetical protein
MRHFVHGLTDGLGPPLLLLAVLAVGLPLVEAAHAEKIVEPATVAPEFREAAEKRHAEQVKLINCNKAAREAKILRRDLAKYVAECFDKPD